MSIVETTESFMTIQISSFETPILIRKDPKRKRFSKKSQIIPLKIWMRFFTIIGFRSKSGRRGRSFMFSLSGRGPYENEMRVCLSRRGAWVRSAYRVLTRSTARSPIFFRVNLEQATALRPGSREVHYSFRFSRDWIFEFDDSPKSLGQYILHNKHTSTPQSIGFHNKSFRKPSCHHNDCIS